MCTEETVNRIVKANATPKWMHNVLSALGTLTVALLIATLSAVLDNKDKIYESELTVTKQFGTFQKGEDARHQIVSSAITSLLITAQNTEKMNVLRCETVTESYKELKDELNRKIRHYHPATYKINE